MLPTQPSRCRQHLLRQGDLQGTPHSFSLQHRRTRASSCSSFPGLQDSQRQSVKPSVCLPAFLHLSWTLTFAFPPASEPLCGCRWAQLLHITVSNIQLHLYPRRLKGETERSLTSHCWDSEGKPVHHSTGPRAKNPQLHPNYIQ